MIKAGRSLTTDPDSRSGGILQGYATLSGGAEVRAGDPCQNRLPPRHVLVCGHARGGTTAVARALIALGFTTDDPNAFLESQTLRALSKKADGNELLSAIRNWKFRDERMFFKDPKLKSARALPLLAEMPAGVGFVFVFRDPLNVAIRNDALKETGLLSALEEAVKEYQKLLRAVEALKNREVLLLSYEKLVVKPAAVIAGLASFLGVDDTQVIRTAVATIVTDCPDYRRNVSEWKRRLRVAAPGCDSGASSQVARSISSCSVDIE
jgi:hypothetical protein